MKHLPLKETGYAVAFLILLACLYVGIYYAMVQSLEQVIYADEHGIEYGRGPIYRFANEEATTFFSIWHGVDHKLRPDHWKSHFVGTWGE